LWSRKHSSNQRNDIKVADAAKFKKNPNHPLRLAFGAVFIQSAFALIAAKPEQLSSRQSLLPYRAHAGNCRYAHRLVLLIRVPRRATRGGYNWTDCYPWIVEAALKTGIQWRF